MKVYIAFAYDLYYPTGPGDVIGVFFSKEDAWNAIDKLAYNFDNTNVKEVEVK